MFKESILILTIKVLSFHIKVGLFKSYMRTSMFYGSETRSVKDADANSLERIQQSMLRWIWNTTMRDGQTSEELIKNQA